MKNKQYLLVVPFIIISLVTGILGGLMRMGWNIPISEIAGEHGALMTGSFLGTVITLERIVVMKKKWMYIFPLLSGSSIVFFFIDTPLLAHILLASSSLGLIFIYLILYRTYKEFYYLIMMLGAVGWLNGNIIMLSGGLYPEAAPWWISFILFTVLGERLELTKFLPDHPLKKPWLFTAIAVTLAGLVIQYHLYGQYLTGTGLILIALWLFRFDMARKSSGTQGIHRHTGILLLAGYFWLVVTGALMLSGIEHPLTYDGIVHVFFLGFTFSMIFAHGPIILPGIAGIAVKPYHPVLFIWGTLLQVSIVIRLWADFHLLMDLRRFAGLLSAVTIVLFLATVIGITIYRISRLPVIASDQ